MQEYLSCCSVCVSSTGQQLVYTKQRIVPQHVGASMPSAASSTLACLSCCSFSLLLLLLLHPPCLPPGALQRVPVIPPADELAASALKRSMRVTPGAGIKNEAEKERSRAAKQLDTHMKVGGWVCGAAHAAASQPASQ